MSQLPMNLINKTFSKFTVSEKPKKNSVFENLDVPILIITLMLLLLGLTMVGSASISIAENQLGNPFYYFNRQLTYLLVSLAAGFIVLRIPMNVWEYTGPYLILVSIVLLLLVFVPGLGKEVNGSQRWINLGLIKIQASEFVKFFVVVYMSGYLLRRRDEVCNNVSGFIKPLTLLTMLSFLLLLQPDYGAVAVMFATALTMMWLAGAKILQFIVLLLSITFALGLVAIASPYRVERLTTFWNPWADPFDSGFQLTQALIAFGRGEWLGTGLGTSIQKLFYLPEAHTDFLIAVMAEELGLVSVWLVIAMFLVLVLRGMRIGRMAEKSQKYFSAYMAYGISIWVGLQAFINIGVNMGVLPTKGLTLPFMSYGGSSLLVMCVAIAVLLRISIELNNSTHKNTRIKAVIK